MMETEHDLKLEHLTMQSICNAWNCKAAKLPAHQRLDFALIRDGEICAFAEIKCRTFEMGRYKDTMLHFDKIMAARALSQNTRLPSLLVVRWTDYIASVDFKMDFKPTMGGRRDRGLERDFGLMGTIPTSAFNIIERLK